MNIIFDGRVLQDHFPGIARYAYNLLLALPLQLGAGDSLAAFRNPGVANSQFDWSALVSQGVQVLDYSMPIFSPANLLFRPSPPAAAHTDVLHFPYYMRPWRAGRPSVTTIHDLISLAYPQLVPTAQARIAIRLFNALAVAVSNAIITVSHSAAADLARHFPAAQGKTVVVYEAPDAIFAPEERERVDAARSSFGLPDRFGLFLASNKPHKNLVRLVEAWSIVIGDWRPGSGEPPALVIAGHQDGRYPEAALRAKALGIEAKVQFIADVPNDDLPALYSACDLFVFPSLYEGFGLPPLEAMACGAPVACSNASSLPEVVGDAALLFDPTRPHEIAAACLRILGDPALQAGLRSRSLRRAAQFTWDETARLTMDVYRSVLPSARHRSQGSAFL